jgi:hypothetical protein
MSPRRVPGDQLSWFSSATGVRQRVLSRSVPLIAHPPLRYHGQRPYAPQARCPRSFGTTDGARSPRVLPHSHDGWWVPSAASTRAGRARVTSTLYRRAEFATTLRGSNHGLPARRDGAPRVLRGARVAPATAMAPSRGPDTRRPPPRTGRPPGHGRARPQEARRGWVRQRPVTLPKDGSDNDARTDTTVPAVRQAPGRPPL